MFGSKTEVISLLIAAAGKWPEVAPVLLRMYRDAITVLTLLGLMPADEVGKLQSVALTPEEAQLFNKLAELCSSPTALFSTDELIEFIGAAMGGGVRGTIAMMLLSGLKAALSGNGKTFLDQLSGKR